MALGVPSSSPAVVIKEVDASASINTAATTIGASVGNFRWGPMDTPVTVANETELAETFGTPDDTHSVDFHTAAYYLKYADNLKMVRVQGDDHRNAYDSDANAGASDTLIKNADDWEAGQAGHDSDKHTFIARWAGTAGNTLKIEVCPADANDSAFDGWAYKANFDAAPGTSSYASDRNATRDEVHVAVIDVNGEFATRGTVLEKFQFVSVGKGAKNTDGSTNYILDVINNGSEYVWMAGFGDASKFDAQAGDAIDSGVDYSRNTITSITLKNGRDVAAPTVGNYQGAFDELEDEVTVDADVVFVPSMSTSTDAKTLVNDVVATAKDRKDIIVAASPSRASIVGVNSAATMNSNVITEAAGYTYSNYLVADNNFLKVYDKYNDKYIQIPACSSTAGIMTATATNAAPWVSPAGGRRGNYLGITSVAYSPTKAQRDALYKVGINPVANIPGQGVILYGDKTHITRQSAFSRINVRRLFTTLEKAIGEFAKQSLFELNDEFTRAEFVNNVEPLLREVQGRRGITDFRVVCDETNNTASVVDRNEFVASIFIKPARSINFITLNFVATRSGATFEEVVGT
ncbi:MAG: hypothetical protein DWQ49_04935 [Bacteroidetes bacterium]|nr:MAG: hypothetical protein DWQ49_04935 [Bacteroidota bacterium]